MEQAKSQSGVLERFNCSSHKSYFRHTGPNIAFMHQSPRVNLGARPARNTSWRSEWKSSVTSTSLNSQSISPSQSITLSSAVQAMICTRTLDSLTKFLNAFLNGVLPPFGSPSVKIKRRVGCSPFMLLATLRIVSVSGVPPCGTGKNECTNRGSAAALTCSTGWRLRKCTLMPSVLKHVAISTISAIVSVSSAQRERGGWPRPRSWGGSEGFCILPESSATMAMR
mmetsp:Transcript_87131/g.221948  ORF Transcript_87131/g.221948 Transcript_87131/m.221948 type:complete len:225 (-) Transcript_87131:109-783(-)